MSECQLCGNEGSRVQVNHEEHGKIMVCSDCWETIYSEGKKITEGTGSESSGASCSACGL